MTVGLVLVIVVALVDDIGFTRETVSGPRWWAPTATPVQGGMTLGLAGTF